MAKAERKPETTVKLVARIDAALMRRFKATAALRGVTIRVATDEAVRAWIRRRP